MALHYLAGLLLLRSRGRRVVVAMVVLVDLGLLVGYKYWSFLLTTVGLPAAAALPLPAESPFSPSRASAMWWTPTVIGSMPAPASSRCFSTWSAFPT